MADALRVQELAGDKRVAENMMDRFPHPYPKSAALDWIAEHERQAARLEGFVWAVTLRDTGELIGCLELSGRAPRGMGLGYWIGVPYWNHGYASEAVRAVIEFGFTELGQHRIHAQHYARNAASGAVMQKAGMKFIGTMRQAALKDGKLEDDVYYEILSSDPPVAVVHQSPTLETERLKLRPWRLEDVRTFAQLSNDPEIADGTLSYVYPQPEGWAESRLARNRKSARDGLGYNFAICLKDSAEVVGDVGLWLETRHKRGEIGYWCGAPYRGNGYITEAARAVLEFGFRELGLSRIQACHFPRNPASGRILQKIGMMKEGVLRGYLVKNGTAEDVIYYAALEADP